MKNSLYIKDAQLFLDDAAKTKEAVCVKALKKNGALIELNGWICLGGWWARGVHRFVNPKNGEIRMVCDILIMNINGHPVYI